jgi:hypothetical protein
MNLFRLGFLFHIGLDARYSNSYEHGLQCIATGGKISLKNVMDNDYYDLICYFYLHRTK